MHNAQWTGFDGLNPRHNGRVVILVLILALILSGCGSAGEPVFWGRPVDLVDGVDPVDGVDGVEDGAAGRIYLEQWLAGVRQMVVESCNAQPDPAGCRAAWRAAVEAVQCTMDNAQCTMDGGMGATSGE